MLLKDAPIKRKILRAILLTSSAVLLFTILTYFIYEFITFRQSSVRELSVQAKIIASNTTAALAFRDPDDAEEILSALKAEPHIIVSAVFDENGQLFSLYPPGFPAGNLPEARFEESHELKDSELLVFQPVVQGDKMLGTLFLRSDMNALYDRLWLYLTIAGLIGIGSLAVAYFLSNRMQGIISRPILSLANTARIVSEKKDYSVRVAKSGNDEIGYLTDAFNQMLTEIERQNDEIRSFNQKLEGLIKKRTQDLEAANKEMEAFSYSVSHDLRAPLRSIIGFSNILMEDYGNVLDKDAINNLNIIMRNGERMGQLIDDLLAFSRLGKQKVTKVKLDIKSIATLVWDDMKSQYNSDSELHIGSLPVCYGDNSMIRQVMQNLIGNALKYSMKKEKAIVEVGSYNENGSIIYFVRDNGAGFDMQYYDKLFGVFQRLHSGDEFEGTGVGLALVHRVITKHEGKVWAEGRINEGATFFFSLPNDIQ